MVSFLRSISRIFSVSTSLSSSESVLRNFLASTPRFFSQLVGFRIDSPFGSLVKPLFQFLHIPVQFIQIDVGENRADDTALRRTAIGVVVLPVLLISSLEKLTGKTQKLFIFNTLR